MEELTQAWRAQSDGQAQLPKNVRAGCGMLLAPGESDDGGQRGTGPGKLSLLDLEPFGAALRFS